MMNAAVLLVEFENKSKLCIDPGKFILWKISSYLYIEFNSIE